MRGITHGGPKELLLVEKKPLLQYALEDLERGGVRDVLVVVSPEKLEIERSFGSRFGALSLQYAVQDRPLGLADALSLAEPFVGSAAFINYLPDNLWRASASGSSMTAQLAHAHSLAPAEHLVGLIALPQEATSRFGSAGHCETEPHLAGGPEAALIRARSLRSVTLVYSKAASVPNSAGPRFKGFPIDLFQSDLFARIRRCRELREAQGDPPGELDDTPILQELARERRLVGVVLEAGELFDCGIPAGYQAACRALVSD